MEGIIKRLLSIIWNSQTEIVVIQIVPKTSDIVETHVSGDNITDLGITKVNYLRIFKEAHEYWHTINTLDREVLLDGDVKTLWNIYYMSLGFMITVNENHTVIKLHERVVKKLYSLYGEQFLAKELKYITTFVCSKLNRINKSSSLWLWIKKLSIITVFREKNDYLFKVLVDRTLESCFLHFANYYAADFLRWSMVINEVTGRVSSNDYLLRRIREKCHENLKDVSMWTLLEKLIETPSSDSSSCVISDYNRFARSWDVMEITSTVLREREHESVILGEFEWLLKVRCPYKTPFEVLLRANRFYSSNALIKEILELRVEDEKEKLSKSNPTAPMYSIDESFVNLLLELLKRCEAIHAM